MGFNYFTPRHRAHISISQSTYIQVVYQFSIQIIPPKRGYEFILRSVTNEQLLPDNSQTEPKKNYLLDIL